MPRVSGKPGSGAQALASIFSYYDRELEAEDVAEALPWHDLMANEVDLIGQGQMNGFEVVVSSGRWSMFETHVRRNDPVLVRIQPVDDGTSISLSSDEYGWVVIIGSSHDQRSIVLARERGKVLVVSREVFEPLWEAAGKRLLIFVPSYRR
ncbi:MAG: hypothetical protein O7G85_16055 [Planctomycetota bacterium]|nr:hypothetical protein [Planctomycetota bacterium]